MVFWLLTESGNILVLQLTWLIIEKNNDSSESR